MSNTTPKERQFGIRAPHSLISQLESKALKRGISKSALAIELMSNSTQFVSIDNRQNLPEVPAVYLVYSFDKLLYIGKTTNLNRRFKSHHRINQFLNYPKEVSIGWFDIESEELLSIEASLIKELEPELNNQNIEVADNQGSRKQANIRIEPNFLETIKKAAASEGTSCTQWILDACKAKLSAVNDATSQYRDTDLGERLARIEDRLKKLESLSQEDATDDNLIQAETQPVTDSQDKPSTSSDASSNTPSKPLANEVKKFLCDYFLSKNSIYRTQLEKNFPEADRAAIEQVVSELEASGHVTISRGLIKASHPNPQKKKAH